MNMRSVASTSLADCVPATSLTAQQASLKSVFVFLCILIPIFIIHSQWRRKRTEVQLNSTPIWSTMTVLSTAKKANKQCNGSNVNPGLNADDIAEQDDARPSQHAEVRQEEEETDAETGQNDLSLAW